MDEVLLQSIGDDQLNSRAAEELFVALLLVEGIRITDFLFVPGKHDEHDLEMQNLWNFPDASVYHKLGNPRDTLSTPEHRSCFRSSTIGRTSGYAQISRLYATHGSVGLPMTEALMKGMQSS